jgi:hypothetical protein
MNLPVSPNPRPCRLGFLGLLHMEVFNQRLEQEYNANVVVTAPTVPYKARLSSARLIKVGILVEPGSYGPVSSCQGCAVLVDGQCSVPPAAVSSSYSRGQTARE